LNYHIYFKVKYVFKSLNFNVKLEFVYIHYKKMLH